MKRYLFFIIILINILYNNTLILCPQEFNAEDKRAFFEQYESQIKTTPEHKEENKS
ncbi:MAG TPA: hypothetical protein VKU36_06090 [Candidatus Babeliales bacterium]|nr:hypothetical protein [Candidatus Babeliales bacterium]